MVLFWLPRLLSALQRKVTLSATTILWWPELLLITTLERPHSNAPLRRWSVRRGGGGGGRLEDESKVYVYQRVAMEKALIALGRIQVQ